jgi:RNA polymerase sigma factor (sigma-70 family)
MMTPARSTLAADLDAVIASTDHDAVRFERVVEVATPYLLHYVRARVRRFPAIDAQDIVQDVLLRAWRSWYVVEPYAMAGWLYRLTINLITDVHRRRTMERAKGLVAWSMVGDDDDLDGPRPVDPQDVEAEALGRVAWETLVTHLEPADACLIDFGVHGMTYAEMAVRYGMTRGGIKSLMWRRREATRQRLGDWA